MISDAGIVYENCMRKSNMIMQCKPFIVSKNQMKRPGSLMRCILYCLMHNGMHFFYENEKYENLLMILVAGVYDTYLSGAGQAKKE